MKPTRPTALLLAASLVVAAGTSVAAGIGGFRADRDCTVIFMPKTELIGVKFTETAIDSMADMMFDMTAKGGRRLEASYTLADGGWTIDEAWILPQLQQDAHFVVMGSPEEAPGSGCIVRVDSSRTTQFFFNEASALRVGDAPPVGQLQSNGLTIPGTRTTYPALGRTFPERLADGTTTIAFAPVPDAPPPSGHDCAWGGSLADPTDDVNVPPVRGLIVGYNVYRLPACNGTTGGQREVLASLFDGDPRTGWVGFVDLRRVLLGVPDDASRSPGPSDLDPGDGVELANPDGIPYDGDEVLLFTDRAAGLGGDPSRAPIPDESYWYVVQPAWRGSLAEFAAAGFTDQRHLSGDHRRDLDGDGSFDAVDLDMQDRPDAGGVEFLSPQSNAANGSIDGLGLTAAGLPLVSKPMFAASVEPHDGTRCGGRGVGVRHVMRRR